MFHDFYSSSPSIRTGTLRHRYPLSGEFRCDIQFSICAREPCKPCEGAIRRTMPTPGVFYTKLTHLYLFVFCSFFLLLTWVVYATATPRKFPVEKNYCIFQWAATIFSSLLNKQSRNSRLHVSLPVLLLFHHCSTFLLFASSCVPLNLWSNKGTSFVPQNHFRFQFPKNRRSGMKRGCADTWSLETEFQSVTSTCNGTIRKK